MRRWEMVVPGYGNVSGIFKNVGKRRSERERERERFYITQPVSRHTVVITAVFAPIYSPPRYVTAKKLCVASTLGKKKRKTRGRKRARVLCIIIIVVLLLLYRRGDVLLLSKWTSWQKRRRLFRCAIEQNSNSIVCRFVSRTTRGSHEDRWFVVREKRERSVLHCEAFRRVCFETGPLVVQPWNRVEEYAFRIFRILGARNCGGNFNVQFKFASLCNRSAR